jgi:mannose-1-phosphate guanylyltransferase
MSKEGDMNYAVIMAGGSGTRLWPLSRDKYPKQALNLLPEKTMFQFAVERVVDLFTLERILVVTRADHTPILQAQVPDLPAGNFIIEPQGRGTAPAIGLAAAHITAIDPQASMTVLTADHYIRKEDHFRKVLAAAQQAAEEGHLVTLGIQPDSASTGFGYIRHGALVAQEGGFEVYRVEDFTEKPDLETAQKMVQSGEYSWNSGMFIWLVSRIMEEFKRQMPDFYFQLNGLPGTPGSPQFDQELAALWPQIEVQSIDYGIMENARDVVVIPVEIGWSDIGSWESMFELYPPDEAENVVVGEHLLVDTSDSLVFGEHRLVAALGVEDLIIIDTQDALLVCSRDREQDVKKIVQLLQAQGQEDLT